MKTTKSTKSLTLSSKSVDPNCFLESTVFETLLPEVCKKFNCSRCVVVAKETQRPLDVFSKISSAGKSKRIALTTAATRATDDKRTQDNASVNSVLQEPDAIFITALYDAVNRLAEIEILKQNEVPRFLIQVIGLLAPYYPQLTKISIRRSGIDAYTIHELTKLLPLSNITEICLDGSILPQANYSFLLDIKSCLMKLSLSGSEINDNVCVMIATKLQYLAPAENNLRILNLSSNNITDIGAKHLGEALRTNRGLRYLNLADNKITDDGASNILDILKEFPLTYNEILEMRKRRFVNLRAKADVKMNLIDDFTHKTPRQAKSTTHKVDVKSVNVIHESLKDPFGTEAVTLKNDYSYCHGNLTLSYLNLAYNNLTLMSIRKLLSVLMYQDHFKVHNQCGLYKVVVEGNSIPVYCSELSFISELLTNKILDRSKIFSHHLRKRSIK